MSGWACLMCHCVSLVWTPHADQLAACFFRQLVARRSAVIRPLILSVVSVHAIVRPLHWLPAVEAYLSCGARTAASLGFCNCPPSQGYGTLGRASIWGRLGHGMGWPPTMRCMLMHGAHMMKLQQWQPAAVPRLLDCRPEQSPWHGMMPVCATQAPCNRLHSGSADHQLTTSLAPARVQPTQPCVHAEPMLGRTGPRTAGNRHLSAEQALQELCCWAVRATEECPWPTPKQWPLCVWLCLLLGMTWQYAPCKPCPVHTLPATGRMRVPMTSCQPAADAWLKSCLSTRPCSSQPASPSIICPWENSMVSLPGINHFGAPVGLPYRGTLLPEPS